MSLAQWLSGCILTETYTLGLHVEHQPETGHNVGMVQPMVQDGFHQRCLHKPFIALKVTREV